MVFAIKVVFSAVLISFASWLAGKKPILAGFIIALPLSSLSFPLTMALAVGLLAVAYFIHSSFFKAI